MRTFADDREVLSETLVVDGTPQQMTDKSCRGERVSTWARSGDRFFSNARLTCDGEPPTTTASVSSLLNADAFLEVQVTTRDGREQVRARRLTRDTGAPPADVADAVRALTRGRVVPALVTVDDAIEARSLVTPTTVEVWLAESGSRASLDRRGLTKLADAKMEERLIDLLVAMAYPEKFNVRRASSGGGSGLFGGSGIDDGFYPGSWSSLAGTYGYGMYGYGFGALGYPYFLGGSYYQPGFIYYVPGGGDSAENAEHGQVVNGQGYTRVQPKEPYRGTATASGSATRGSSGGAESSGGSDASSGGGSTSGATPSGYSSGGGRDGPYGCPSVIHC
ncbi:MAG: hypothetical protein QM736_11605 [Vicinamibacterales bacterium]